MKAIVLTETERQMIVRRIARRLGDIEGRHWFGREKDGYPEMPRDQYDECLKLVRALAMLNPVTSVVKDQCTNRPSETPTYTVRLRARRCQNLSEIESIRSGKILDRYHFGIYRKI